MCRRHSSTGDDERKKSESITRKLAASDPLQHMKSTFQAYAAALPFSCSLTSDPDANSQIHTLMRTGAVPALLAHLNEFEPRTRRATHAMYAWRTQGHPLASFRASHPTGQVLCGSSNGGEAGAGERLERLLELGKCEDVVVVVFRWYGGVKLGSERWKCISSVAKEALERGGFIPGPQDSPIAKGPQRTVPSKRRR
ncbi:ribosomal protein S5 domain 2-like protein [Trametes sanguinea]|nr:ribosomal protein S5 domain 2-like protein [Trametes sanguinea]